MNIGILEKALKEFIEKNTKDLKFKQQDEDLENRVVKVFRGFIPPNTLEDEIPAIAIRFNKGIDNIETRIYTIEFYFALYDRDAYSGYGNLILLIQRVIDRITEEKYIGEYFAYADDAKYEIAEEQPYPFWIGFAELKFEAPKTSFRR